MFPKPARSRCKQCRAAFSLVEVLVAMTVLAGGILGVMGTFSLATQSGSKGLRLEDAALLAERELMLAVVVPQDQMADLEKTERVFQWSLQYVEKPHGLMAATVVVQWLQQGNPQQFQLTRVFVPRPAAEG